MPVINYAYGVDALDPAFAYQASSYAFDAEDDAQFVPVNRYFEAAAATDVQVVSALFQEADDATRVQYFERDDMVFAAPWIGSALIDSDEYANGDGDNDDGYIARGTGDASPPDLGVPHYLLTGVCRNSSSVALGAGVGVEVFDTASNALVAKVSTDATGTYAVPLYYPGPFFAVAYQAGAPDIAGTTVNTLTPTPQ